MKKNIWWTSVKNENIYNKELAEELHKKIISETLWKEKHSHLLQKIR